MVTWCVMVSAVPVPDDSHASYLKKAQHRRWTQRVFRHGCDCLRGNNNLYQVDLVGAARRADDPMGPEPCAFLGAILRPTLEPWTAWA